MDAAVVVAVTLRLPRKESSSCKNRKKEIKRRMFYLGTHTPSWLWSGQVDVPLFVSHRRLSRYKNLKRSVVPWCLDSGGFTELSMYGKWTANAYDYIQAVRRYQEEIGSMLWASPQDWMCEPHIVKKTGLSVKQHQINTVTNYITLKTFAPDLPFIPVLQGYTTSEYFECWELYEKAGVHLVDEPVVGVGSICRRQGESEIHRLLKSLHDNGLRIHAFGLKTKGVQALSGMLESYDSMGWSFAARRKQILLEECRVSSNHKTCANCYRFALLWRENLLRKESFSSAQYELFEKQNRR